MKKNMIMIIIYFFIQGVLHNLGHPVTPFFVEDLGISDYMFGLFFSAMSLGLMFGAPLWGSLSDRGHRKLYIAIGLTVYSFGQIAFGYIGHPTLMVIARFISGFSVVSGITIMTAIVVEQTHPNERAKLFAFLAAASTLGASLGYFIGGQFGKNLEWFAFLGNDTYAHIFLLQGVLNMIYVLFILLTLRDVDVKFAPRQRVSMIQGLKSLTKIDTSLLLFMLSLTMVSIGSTNLSKYIDVYFKELGYSSDDLGTYVMVTGIVSLLTSIFLVKYVAKFKNQLGLLGFMQLSSAIIVFIVFRANRILLALYTIYMVYVVLRTLFSPLEQNYIARQAKEGMYGSVMGLRQSFVSLGMVIGPLIGGFLYEISPLVLFDFNAITFLLGLLLLYLVWFIEMKRKKRLDQANEMINATSFDDLS